MMLSHRLLAGIMLAPKSKCSVPGSFENETLLIIRKLLVGWCRMEVQPEEIDQISDISRIPRISSFSEIKYHECKVGSLCEWGFPRV